MPTNPYEPPQGKKPTANTPAFQKWLASSARRLKVVGIGLAIGVVFSLYVTTLMPFEKSFTNRVHVIVFVLAGPIVPTTWGMLNMYLARSGLLIGWLGLALVAAHPIRPNVATACLTLLGMALWFFAGFWGLVHATM